MFKQTLSLLKKICKDSTYHITISGEALCPQTMCEYNQLMEFQIDGFA